MKEKLVCQHCGAPIITEKTKSVFTEYFCNKCGFPNFIQPIDDDLDNDPVNKVIKKIASEFMENTKSPISDEDFEYYQQFLDRQMKKLYPVEKQVMSALYGLDNGVPQTLEEVAKSLNTNIKTVEQIKENALRRLYKVC